MGLTRHTLKSVFTLLVSHKVIKVHDNSSHDKMFHDKMFHTIKLINSFYSTVSRPGIFFRRDFLRRADFLLRLPTPDFLSYNRLTLIIKAANTSLSVLQPALWFDYTVN